MKDYEAEPEETVTSKINSGMLINLRLHELWKDAHRHARQGKYSKWNDDLDRVWCELGGDVKELNPESKSYKESDDENKKYEATTLEYANACEDATKSVGWQEPSKEERQSKAKQKKALIKKEIFLRRLQNKQGKGTAYHDSSEDYMD